MSVFNTKMFRLIGLLFVILTLAAFNARAALPDAGTAIGTQAIVQYQIDDDETVERVESNIVTTTIAQVYETKIEVLGGIAGKAGEDVDIRFAVRNIGNGADKLTMSMTSAAGTITKYTLMPADSNGKVDESDRTAMDMDKPFTRDSVARDQARHFVARVAVPPNAVVGDLKFVIKATNADNTGDEANVVVKIVDGSAFTVEPGKFVLKDGKTFVDFKVKGGAETGAGHFDLIVAKKSDISAPVKFEILNNQIIFNGKNVATSAITPKDNVMTFKIDAVAATIDTDFKMGIAIAGAKLGEEYVMYVKYGSKAESLIESQAIQISYAHTMKAPTLDVTGNSARSEDKFFNIASAVSGDTVDYTVVLKNKSSSAENFTLQLNKLGTEINEMWLVDKNGNRFSTINDNGLPETGLIPVGGELTFKVKASLKHGIDTEVGQQSIKLIAKSITDPKTAAVDRQLFIEKVEPVQTPDVKFLKAVTDQTAAAELIVAGSDDVATYYLHVGTPDQSSTAQREYQIRFNLQDTTFQQVINGKAVGREVSEMAVRVGNKDQAGIFMVKTKMRGLDKLTASVTVSDVQSKQAETATIELKKDVSIGFLENGYKDKGTIGLDTLLTVNVMNTGRAVNENEFEIYAPEMAEWDVSFSLNGETWAKELALPAIASKTPHAIKVKIRVPKNVKAGAIETLKLALRKQGKAVDTASVSIALTISKSVMKIEKSAAVVKEGTSANGEKNFVKDSAGEVKNGDTIWYQVVVTNPIDAPTAKHVKITDTLPAHVKFDPAKNAGITKEGNNVTMQVGDMEAGASKTMEYQVTVELRR